MKRRQFIKSGLALGTFLALGIECWPRWQEDRSQSAPERVLSALLPALLHGGLPADPVEAEQAISRTVTSTLAFLPFLPERQQQDLAQLFHLLDSGLVRLGLTGHVVALSSWTVSERLALLHRWRDSYVSLLQQAYSGLRELLYGAYYGQPAHWPAIHYQPLEFRHDD